jgi:hypothetical protein
MSRFNIGDNVSVLPQYGRLYPTGRGVVLSVKPDRMGRSIFDEYLVEFYPNYRKVVFDFRLADDRPNLRTTQAKAASKDNPDRVRGSTSQHIVMQTRDLDVHLKSIEHQGNISLLGQILEKKSERLLSGVEVRLLRDNAAIGSETTNDAGEFRFSGVLPGLLALEILLRPNLTRVVGTFTLARSKTA